MSAFIVSNATIHRAVWGMKYAKLTGAYDKELGQKLYALNAEAVQQRYGDDFAERVNFTPEPGVVSKISAVKALHCLRYQCSEGNVPSKKLFKMLSRAIEILSEDIVCNLPEWNSVPWDGE